MRIDADTLTHKNHRHSMQYSETHASSCIMLGHASRSSLKRDKEKIHMESAASVGLPKTIVPEILVVLGEGSLAMDGAIIANSHVILHRCDQKTAGRGVIPDEFREVLEGNIKLVDSI